jgi:hypothetical protein
MTDREKLVDLLAQACEWQDRCIGCKNNLPVAATCREERFGKAADHLIANGVTVREWIPLTEEKPDRDEHVLVFFEGMRGTPAETQIVCGWCIDGSATHWQHRPEPPKGVNHV